MKNTASLIGRLGQDPTVRYLDGGTAVANFSIVTTRKWTAKNGQKQERPTWHKIVVFGKQAERIGQYLKKGRLVDVEGEISNREYTDKENVKRQVTEIRARSVTFLDSGVKNVKDVVPPAPEAEGNDIAEYDEAL